jgi:SnoaL-like domain
MMDLRDLHELRLDEMDEQEAFRFLTLLLSKLDPEEEYAVRHEDYVLEMPQSGERIRGRENMRAFQRSYSSLSPSEPTRRVRVRRVLVKEGLWVVEGIADYPEGRTLGVIMISELREGKMWRDRWYFADPFEAPEWRSQWVERQETGTGQG